MSQDQKPEKSQTQKSYESMNASEKTKFMGFKHFSERELNQRQLANEKRRVEIFQHLLEMLVAIPNKRLGKHLTDKELAEVFMKPLNDFYYWVVDKGYTAEDLKATMDNLAFIRDLIERSYRQTAVEVTKLNYAITGENDLADLPINKVMAMAKAGMESRPDEPVVLDPEPEERS